MFRWIARSILILNCLLALLYGISISWDDSVMLRIGPVVLLGLVVGWIWELHGGISLITVCLAYLSYGSFLQWQSAEFEAESLVGSLLFCYGSIYAWVAYAAWLVPGVLLIVSWRMARQVRRT